jgi:glycosyltransferase involved in cell wall biosynthesis
MAHSNRPQILITHPGRQHSHQAAIGLERAGLLAGYWAGVPSLAEHGRWVPRRLWSRYEVLPLPPHRVRWAPWAPALRRLGDRLSSPAAPWVDFAVCRRFDRWAAARLDRSGAAAVVACEISALSTFAAAKRLGMTTFLDAPSFHHATQDRVQPTLDSPGLHRRLAGVKDAELALADHVLTVSELARESYLESGFPGDRVHALPLGADLDLFEPRLGNVSPPAATTGEFVFLFAGASLRRKGFDLLSEAFRKVAAACPHVRLRVVGPRGDAADALAASEEHVTLVGAVDQPTLAAHLRNADCLVLPSRHDSFGMVVVEALASGTPAMVSSMVGAKDLVDEGVTGWVVPLGDQPALVDRMLWCARHPAEVRAMRPACRRRAEGATWEAYHARLVELMDTLVGGGVESRAPRGSAA